MTHLEDLNQTYFEHLKDAIGYSIKSFTAGFIFLIHGFFPDILVTNGSDTISELNNILIIKKKMLTKQK